MKICKLIRSMRMMRPNHPILFSERNGYQKTIFKLGRWRLLSAPISVAVYRSKDACFWCGSPADPYYSRIAPMGYVCPDCGKSTDNSENVESTREG